MTTKPISQHATCIRLDGRGVLLRGPSGSGKSDLAWRLMQPPFSAELVADDQTRVVKRKGSLFASCPEPLQGLLEMRGLGLISLPFLVEAPLHLVVELVPRDDVPRMPEPTFAALCGLELPSIALHAFDLTAPDKVRLAANLIAERGFPDEDGIIGRLN